MDIQTFIVHYSPLVERKKFMLEQLNKYELDNTFIEQYDRNNLLDEDVKIFHKDLDRFHCAINLSHFFAYKQVLNNDKKYNLIFEDDVILSDNFKEKLGNALNQLPDDYDMLFIGDGCNLHIHHSFIKEGQLIYEKKYEPKRKRWGQTRCTDSYFVSKKGASKILDYISKIKDGELNLEIDWFLNDVCRNLKLKVYWLEPTIVTQGTQNGTYNSCY